MENKFIKIDFKYLNREDITFLQAGILSYLSGFQENGLYCYQSERELAEIFSSSRMTINRSINDLINKGLIFKSNDKKYLIPFQNRKVTILVDNNNPLPIAENNAGQDNIPKRYNNTTKPILNSKANYKKKKDLVKDKVLDYLDENGNIIPKIVEKYLK